MTTPAATLDPERSNSPSPARPSLPQAIRLMAGDIKLAHSVFALPFAVLAAFVARDAALGWGRFLGQLALVVACMVLARSWAMLFNRLADAKIDAANPRTQRRVFAAGGVSTQRGWLIALLCAAGFMLACAGFWWFFANRWPTLLGPLVLVWIAFYSLTKRFTWLCHLVLGTALAASPVSAAIAINPAAVGILPGEVGVANPFLWWIAGMVTAWVAGFDVIYALQDTSFDRGAGLKSIPASLGTGAAAWISRVLHLVAFACLVMAWRGEPRLGAIFAFGVALTAGLLVTEHVVLAKRGEAGLDTAFFTLNGIVSLVLGAAGVVDLFV
ncbi:MAG: UbiA-like polyprenyltransferase [Planctomycetota bacterium]|nr:UbiA-like polyprenyltransferase [Planctomycetota bacterium]